MPVPNQVESIVKDELFALMGQLERQVEDPRTKAALVAMAEDAAMMPLRVARGENVEHLLRALSAEAQNRALAHRQMVQQLVQEAWIRAIGRIMGFVLKAL